MFVSILRWLKALWRGIGQWWAILLALPRAVSFFGGSLPRMVRQVYRVFLQEGMTGVLRRAQVLVGRPAALLPATDHAPLYGDIRPSSPDYRPLVSVIVPNYNHAAYLEERLQSIYGQSYDHIEVILLDDASTDDSRRILQTWADRHPDRTRCHFNEENSGGVFYQWKKGLSLARGELVWIAESDDSCSPDFLHELVRCFQTEGVRLAFARTEFVEGTPPRTVWTQSQYLHDLGGAPVWEQPFIRSAHALVKHYWIVKNIVPNVSGAVFRHPGNLPLFEDEGWLSLRLCGDWVFYTTFVRGGLVAYNPTAVNHYRQHAANTSVNAQKEAIYYSEHEEVARRLAGLYALSLEDLRRQERALYGHWCVRHGSGERADFEALYDPERALAQAGPVLPNILMAVYALVAGGGETFPIILANALAQKGYGITLLNCRQKPTEPGMRGMVSAQVPVLELERFDRLPQVCDDMGIQIVHSHHAWSDTTVAMWLMGKSDVRHVVTNHGMYETMTGQQVETLMRLLRQQADAVIYTAEKNLASLPPDLVRAKPVLRIDNALPPVDVEPVARENLRLAPDDFVLCLVSRAIPEKGWAEAVEALALANRRPGRRIVLLLIGEGPEFDRLQRTGVSDAVRLLGFKTDIRNYFAMADMGFLPSRFLGESAPLVLIDCLLAGRPMLASDIGEIRYMLDTEAGPAGELLALNDWQLDVVALADVMRHLADAADHYRELVRRVPDAARKFEIGPMVEKYETVYRRVLT